MLWLVFEPAEQKFLGAVQLLEKYEKDAEFDLCSLITRIDLESSIAMR